MSGQLQNGEQQFFDNNGKPLNGGTIDFYVPNTTTRKTTWQDQALTIQNTNPIVLDAGGKAIIWGSGSYRQVLKDNHGNLIWDKVVADPIVSLSGTTGASQVGADDGVGGSIFTTVAGFISSLKSSIGSSLVGFIQAGAGAIAMTVQSKLRLSVHVKDFGAVGDGVADDTAAIQKAISASLHVNFGGPADSYKVSGSISLSSDHFLFGKGAVITQTAANTEVFNFEGKSNVKAMGLRLIGLGDYIESDSSRAVAFFGGVAGANNHIFRCHFVNFGYTPARFKAQRNCSFTYNTVEGPGAPPLVAVTTGRNYGVLFDTGCIGALIHGNDITKTGQGVRVEGTTNCRITSNYLHDIAGQHGIYAGSAMNNLVIAGNNIDTTPLIGIKVQAQDTAGVDNLNISITGNTVSNYGDQGILVCSAVSPATYKCRDVTVTGNTVRQGTGSGINLNNTVSAVINSNTVDLAGFTGINISECSNLKIDANFVTRSGLSAIRDVLPCSHISITNNQIVDCATLSAPSDKYGILVQGGSEYNITGNDISDANAKMTYAIYIVGGATTTFCIDDNTCICTSDYAFRIDTEGALRSYRDNYFSGAVKATYNDPSVASVVAASLLSLPPSHRVVRISSGPNITYIDPNGQSGSVIVLMPDAGVVLKDGSNLRLNGDFTSTTDDTITIACDGGNWLEVSRSAN